MRGAFGKREGAEEQARRASISRPRLGVTLFGVLNALDQRGLLGAELVPYRLHRCLEGRFVLDLVDLGPGLLHLLHGLFLARIPELALLLLRFLGELHDERLVILGKAVPASLREDEDL